MKKEVIIGILSVLIILLITIFILSQNNSKIYQGKVINQDSYETNLDSLRIKANVECLQNLQCSEGFECVENKCIEKSKINLCQEVKLFSNSRKLELGQPINSIKSVLTDDQLPYLLPDGELVELIDNKLIEYFYIQMIFIGENNLEKENKDYFININNEPVYTYRLMFSTGIDFSNKNIQGQVLRILGKEYIISNKSDNSFIELISDDKKFKLENGKKVNDIVKGSLVNIKRNEEGNIIMLEILFNMQDKNISHIKVKENYSDPVFNAIKLSFDNADDGFADIRIGGNC